MTQTKTGNMVEDSPNVHETLALINASLPAAPQSPVMRERVWRMYLDSVVHEVARRQDMVLTSDEQWLLDIVYKHVTPHAAMVSPINWKRWQEIDPGQLTHFVGLAVGYLYRHSHRPNLNSQMHGFVNYHCVINTCEFLAGYHDHLMRHLADDMLGIPCYSTLCGQACANKSVHILTRCTKCAKLINPTIVEMATECVVNRDYGIMPIMADALEDQGCTNEMILDHCRSSGPHGRGCWVLRHLLSGPLRKKRKIDEC